MGRIVRKVARRASTFAAITASGAAMTLIAGCGNASKPPDETALRASFQRKGPINIQDVPPDKRAMVQALMDASKKGPPPAKLASKK